MKRNTRRVVRIAAVLATAAIGLGGAEAAEAARTSAAAATTRTLMRRAIANLLCRDDTRLWAGPLSKRCQRRSIGDRGQ